MAAAAVLSCAVVASPRPAAAVDDERGRPWGRGTVMPSFGFGVAFGQDLTQIGVGLGASYFVWHGLSLGLGLSNQFLIWSSSFKNMYPGIEDQIPTNIFRITPSAQYVFYRSRWFSPYVSGGIGPTFFNNAGGVHGHWVAGPGAYIGLGGPVFLDVGVNFSGMFPKDRCNDAFIYEGVGGERVRLEGMCSFGWGPRIGLILAFGSRGRGRAQPSRRTAPPPDRYEPPPENPMQPEPARPQPDPWAGPDEEPGPEPEPPVQAEPPVEPPAEPPVEPPAETEREAGLDEPPPSFDPEPPP
jgi:hypothetical protein